MSYLGRNRESVASQSTMSASSTYNPYRTLGHAMSSSSVSTVSSQESTGRHGNSLPRTKSLPEHPMLPPLDLMNPYAHMGCQGDRRWQPVPDLYHSKESLALRATVGKVLKRVHEEISRSELEIRANTPEFRVLESDWVAHTANNQFAFITPLKTVSRIPANLLILDSPSTASSGHQLPTMSGYLRKRGETNRSFKKRYMELNGTIMTYYKKKPEKNGIPLTREDKKAYERGSIDLEKVSSIQPSEIKNEPFGIHLVTTNRTWSIAAESEQGYMAWLKPLCHVVKFNAVHVTFKRMFQLQEVSSQAVTDVRMVIATGDTVSQVVEHIFNCYKQKLNAAPLHPYDPSKFVLKITGYRDYLIDRFRSMNEYMHVRECLLTKKTLRLTLVHESVIQDTALRSLSIHSDIPLGHSLASNQYAHQLDSGERPSSLAMTTMSEDWDKGALREKDTPFPSGAVQEPFVVKILRVVNIPRTTAVLKRSSEEAVVEYKPIISSSVIVRLELYDGCQLIDGTALDTSDARLKAQHDDLLYAEWDEPVWHRFNINISELTRSIRVQLTLYGVNHVVGSSTDPDQEKLLVTGTNAFDVDGFLIQGQHYIQMLNNLNSCKAGPVPHTVLPTKPVIVLEFSKYQSGVKFDWSLSSVSEAGSGRLSRRTTVGSYTRSAMLRKEGWLHKVGFSKWTRWRRRWFVVDQTTCTLSYADDESAPRKVIPLQNCSVGFADDMNEKYTTCPVNKGTRKERQTWCFKVRPFNSSRDYIISAETKQGREEWMLAIHTVSRTESDIEATEVVKFSGESDSPTSGKDGSDGSGSEGSRMRRDSASRGSDTSSSFRSDKIIADLRRVILMDPLYRLSPYQKAQMWSHREEFIEHPEALPRVLSCVHWGDKDEVDEALKLLPRWAVPTHPAAYMELLDGEFAHEGVRSFAVSKLSEMADTTFSYFLPQLVQALKFENHHVSPLAVMLIERAIKNPNQIGFDLFWGMKVEAHNPQYRELYGTLLNAYLDVCSHKMREILKLQDKLFSADGMFDRICQTVKAKKKEGGDEMKRVMHEGLAALNEILPSSFQLPIDPRVEVGKIIVHKCRVMDSAKKPLWLVFENAEEGGDPVTVIFKAGDDVRQDCLTLQLIRLMDEMWRDEGLDLAMEPYKCVATSPMTGVLQVVPNSVTTADVHKRVGILGAFKDPSFSEWIRANNPDRKSHKKATDLFSRSCAGYCVATCVLGIGDRHNDNIMISSSGRYFHIDFGHFLGHFKYQYGVRRERTPFVFTKEMAHVLGGTESPEFEKFVDTCCTAYNVIRKHMHLLVSLLLLMIPADMPELTGRDDINHLVQTMAPELAQEQARESFVHAIHFCLDSKFKRIDNTIHIFAHLFK